MGPLLLKLLLQGVLLNDALAWYVSMPLEIRGLKGSCLVIPCSFYYTSYPPKDPRRVVWYQWVSIGYPLVYDPSHPNYVIEKFREKTYLYREPSSWDCSLLIKNLELYHHGEKLYTWIDPENVGWRTYKFYDVTSTIVVDTQPHQPSIYIYGGERTGDTVTVACSASHTCPFSKPKITLSGIEGTDEIRDESKDSLWKITLTRTGVLKAERSTIKCSVTHYGDITVTATEDKSAECAHHKITIEPELADVTEGIAKNFICSVYHSCQKENPTITWNYENMQVTTGNKKLSGLDQISYSNITFLAAKEDNEKKLICTATFSGADFKASVVLRVQQYQKPASPMQNETYFQHVADVIPKITALPRSCVVIPCSFKMEEEYVTRLRVLWVTKKGGFMFHTDPVDVLDNFKGRTRLLGNPDEQDCTVEMDNVQTHDNGPFCFRAERENERYSFNNSCVFIIMRASPDKPVMSSLPEDIEPGTRVAVKCSVNHTCSSHPPQITWSVPTARETISHSHMGGGVWETVSAVTFIPTGYEEKDEIVCTAKFWGGKTQENTAFLSIRRVQGVGFGPYVIGSSLVFILICIFAGVFIYKRRHNKPGITLNGIEGNDQIRDESIKNGPWKTTLTRTGVVKAERLKIECSVTHYGGIKATATQEKSAQCVHHKITIEPELADVTVGIAKNFICRVYHSCKNKNPTITWNYENMQVTTGSKTLSGLNQISYSSITFLGAKEDHGKKLICTAKFSGGYISASVVLHVQRILLYDALGWEVSMPKDIHGLKGSCLVIPCSFSYKSNPPKNPRRVVWYQRVSTGYPLVYDAWYPNDVIGKFRGKTDLYGKSDWDCSLLIKNLEPSHNGEKLYTRIDPENIAWQNYETDDATSTVLVDATPLQPSISIYGGERTGETVIVACSAFHTCPYSKPNIILNGIKGSDEIKDESVKDGLWKITLTRTGVVKAESTTIKCSVTHYGGITVTDTEVKISRCVHHNISIEPELADVTEGVAQNFTCTIYHSCQKENPAITWNYENMQVLEWNKKHSDLDHFQVAFSNITFLGAKEDHGKKLICTAKFSGGNIETYVVLHVQQYQKPVDQILNETYFQYVADVIPKITALPRSCVVIPCSFKMEEEYITRLRVLWVTKKGGFMFHTDPVDVLDNFKGRTRLLGNPDEQDCTVEMDNVQTHDNGPFCFRAERENERYSFNNSCVFIIMRAPNGPVMSSLPEDIEPGTRVAVKCSVNHTCSSHPPQITWSVPTARETISHSHMGGGVWETVSAVIFIPTGYEEKDEIVCTAKFWGGKTQENTAFLSIRRLNLETVGLYAIAPSLVFILICVLAGVFICKRRHRQPHHDMQGSRTQAEQRRSFWNRFSSRFSMPEGRAAWTNRGNRSNNRYTGNSPERPPKPEQRRSIWSRFSRHQSPRTNANLRAEYKANNTCTVSGNKPFSKPHMPSPKSEPKSYRGYDYDADLTNIYGNC
ncbi:uncharacterized protein LOC107747662 [Sinocyclocheilus rhinocerous]|uniref:uncharacterized protein LOC107747662 n=1 Tax=Sinocyclocheilus rhinocerous TaxID=307959 RepID=UPI0007BA7E1F|nr:PREDICTED: uncharacterized protein LOC107747662 [Sinocyclocheilus rhinocerous]